MKLWVTYSAIQYLYQAIIVQSNNSEFHLIHLIHHRFRTALRRGLEKGDGEEDNGGVRRRVRAQIATCVPSLQ